MPHGDTENMNTDDTRNNNTPAARIALAVFFCTFGLYLLNVLVGKAIIVYGWKIFHFGSIMECLILFSASVAFIAAALIKEAAFNAEPQQ
jgi:hypothetical protein